MSCAVLKAGTAANLPGHYARLQHVKFARELETGTSIKFTALVYAYHKGGSSKGRLSCV